MKEILVQMGFPVRAAIAEMMPSRRLYHIACKAMGVDVNKGTENRRYTRTTTNSLGIVTLQLIQSPTVDHSWRYHCLDGLACIYGSDKTTGSFFIDGVHLIAASMTPDGRYVDVSKALWDGPLFHACETEIVSYWAEYIEQQVRRKREAEEIDRQYWAKLKHAKK